MAPKNPPPVRETATLNRLHVLGYPVELLGATFLRHSFSRHAHEGYAVGIIERGELGFRYRGAEHVAPAGHVNLVIPGEAHNGYGAAGRGWSYRMFYLPPELMALVNAQVRFAGAGWPHFRTGVLADHDLARRVAATHRALSDPATGALERETRLLALLRVWIGRHAEDRPGWPRHAPEHAAVRRVAALLRERSGDDLSLSELAAHARLSPFHLARVFERETGLPPHAYLLQVRLGRATELLAGSGRLADIAADCGFADQSHLTREFKRAKGVTPGRYRKILQNSAA